MLCRAVHRGWGRRGTKSVHLLSIQQILPSLPPVPYPLHNTFPSSSITVSFIPSTPFPNRMPPYPPCTLFHSSSSLHPYNSTYLICQYPLIPPKFHTSPINAPYLHLHHSHTLHLSSIIIFHFFLPSNNPAEPVLSLNISLTTSSPCTDLKYLSTLQIFLPTYTTSMYSCCLLPPPSTSHFSTFLPVTH